MNQKLEDAANKLVKLKKLNSQEVLKVNQSNILASKFTEKSKNGQCAH
jgi:hypothetical protein